jgi:hypothetical protein
MDYETRKRLIFNYLTAAPDGVLLRYSRPKHLGDDSARGEINDMVEDLNGIIPSVEKESFFAILERFKVSLRQMGSSRNWPTIPQAIRAMKEAIEGGEYTGELKPMKTPMQIASDRINAGEAVGDHWISGIGAEALLEAGWVTQTQIDGYKRGLL